jgi:uncharacterized protein (UPF0276 family)
MSLFNPSHAPAVPALGFGLGLRTVYYPDLLGPVDPDLRPDWIKPQIDWLEAISDNYMVAGGAPLFHLMRAREQYPIALHGVSLSIGSTDPLDFDYLAKLKTLIARVEPAWVSDHICWTGVHGLNLHDLLPLPYTQATLNHVVERINRVQDYLGRQLVLENVSSYLTFAQDEMSEWDFVAELARRSDSLILLDVNNIYVSSRNHGFDPMIYLSAMPAGRIAQMHLAGHTDYGDHVIDTHDHAVCDPVFDLFVAARNMFGPVSAMIERDDHFPPFDALMAELDHMRALAS